MTAISYHTPFGNASDAEFRAWVTELYNTLIAAGLVQTADSGQINLASVVRAAVSTAAGYHIFRFSDGLQATVPVFIKIEYGSGSTVNTMPGFWITVGTGSNGTGTITGLISTRSTWHINNAQPVTRPLLTNVCVKDGYLMIAFKRHGLSLAALSDLGGFLVVCRTVDDTGANNGDGVFVFNAQSAIGTGPYIQTLGFAASFTSLQNIYFTYPPRIMTNSQPTTSTIQIHKCFGVFPTVRPCAYLAMCQRTEIPDNVTFSAALVGGTSRTYYSLTASIGYVGLANDITRSLVVVFD